MAELIDESSSNRSAMIIITVIVATYNRCDLLKEALMSLFEQTRDRYKYEIIVVDNNSTDNTRQVAQEFAANYDNVKVFKEEEQGRVKRFSGI